MEVVQMPKEMTKADKKRRLLRKKFWPTEDAWTGQDEVGFFQAPRSLPLILYRVMGKRLRANRDVARVYLELWARHIGQGVIEMAHEAEHAFFSGYTGARAVRTWRERMNDPEKLGFIKINRIGDHIKLVLLVHPAYILHRLREEEKIDQDVWDAYEQRRIDTKEPSHEERLKKGEERKKVVTINKASAGPAAL